MSSVTVLQVLASLLVPVVNNQLIFNCSYSWDVEDSNTTCSQHMQYYNKGLDTGELWALQVQDAAGRYPGGVYTGSGLWIGSPSLCYQVNQGGSAPVPLAFTVAEYRVNVTGIKSQEVTQGICLPEACSEENILALLQKSDTADQQVISIRKTNPNYKLWDSTSFKILTWLFTIIAVLTILGTCFHLFLHIDPVSEPSISLRCSKTAEAPQESRLAEVALSFSIVANATKICSLSVGDDTLAPVHGLRLLSMLWVMLVHTCLIVFEVADNKFYRDQVEDNFLYKTLSSGAYSVDTFFVISGCLVTFLYLRTRAKYTLRQLTSADGTSGQCILLATMLFYRFIRLTPPYVVVLAIVAADMTWLHQTSALRLPSNDHVTCNNDWLPNILYFNTFLPLEQQCMNWSWYLADDTQFYVVAAIILVLSIRYPKPSVIAVGILLVGGWLITGTLTLYHHHIPNVKDPFALYDSLYDKPWARIGPYLVGMAAGWLLYHNDCIVRFNKPMLWAGWSVCTLLTAGLVYGGHLLVRGPISAVLYVSLNHTAWGLGVAWALVACVTGYGSWLNEILSWKYLYPLSRVTYCAYLIHPQIMRHTVLSADSPTHISTFNVGILYFGFVLTSYMSAFVFSVLFEAPFVGLLRLIRPKKQFKHR